MLIRVAWKSLRYRKTSVLLTLFAITLSVSLLLSVEHVRSQLKQSFTRTVSGVDLIIGARSSQINLLLYSVFRIGTPTGAIDSTALNFIYDDPNVEWTIPIALGDAHKGHRVVGTTNDYFAHFKYGNKQSLTWASGSEFTQPNTAVLGANVAKQLAYNLGESFVLSHGVGNVSFSHHEAYPVVVNGILAATGTPVDDAIYVTLEALTRMHDSPQKTVNTLRKPHAEPHSEEDKGHDGEHEHEHVQGRTYAVSALMIGLKTPVASLQLQHKVNQYKTEPLMAILPGVALNELWSLMGNAEKIMLALSGLILIASLLGMATMMLSSMRERQQEIAVLRAMGAGAPTVLVLIQVEAILISLGAVLCAVALVSLSFYSAADVLRTEYGLFITGTLASDNVLKVALSVLVATVVVSLVPAVSAYKRALHSGLTTR